MGRTIKGLLLTTVMLWAAVPGQAGELRLGAQGGLNLSTLRVGNLESGLETDGRHGYDAGLRAEIALGHAASVVLAPSLVQRGGAVVEPVMDQRLQLDTRYLEIPFLLKLSAGSGAARPYLLAGASFAWSRDGRLRLSVAGTQLADDDLSADLTGSDVLLQGGLGIDLAVGERLHVFAEGLYGWGLKGVDSGDPTAADFIDAKNRGLAVRAGITLRLGR